MANHVIDARGSFCPGPMMELIRGSKSAAVGETVTVLSTDSGSRRGRSSPPWWNTTGTTR